MPTKPTIIAITGDDGICRKVTKIQPYGIDGFAAFAPYHAARHGYMIKHSSDYSRLGMRFLPVSGPVEYFVSGVIGTLLATQIGHSIFEHDGEVVECLFPVSDW